MTYEALAQLGGGELIFVKAGAQLKQSEREF